MGLTSAQIQTLCQRVDDIFADAPTRIQNVLKGRQHISEVRETYYLGQLLAHTERDFIDKIPGSSKKTAAYIKEKLQERGYALGALADHKQDLVTLFKVTPQVEAFAAHLRGLPLKSPVDLSVVPRDVQKETDAAWVRGHFPTYAQDIPEQFVAAALGDPRVGRKFKAFVDFTRQVAIEKQDREGGPA